MSVLPQGDRFVALITDAVHGGTGFVLHAQIRESALGGGIPLAIDRLPDNGHPEVVRLNADITEIRSVWCNWL